MPALCLDHLTSAQARAFMIADNRLTEIASWDDRLLAEQLRDLSLSGLDFRLEVTGFEMGEIDLRIASLEDMPLQDEDPADVLPEVAVGLPVSKLGEVWVLGRHRILCGNALDPQAFTALMGEQRATMVFTDPPYNVPIDGHASGLGAIHHRPFPMASGEMDKAEFTAFLAQACRNLATFSAAGSLHYICMDWRHLDELLAAGADAYGEVKNLCVWVKANAGMGSLYRSQHELVLVFKQPGGAHRNNVQLGQFGRNRSNVWNYARPAHAVPLGSFAELSCQKSFSTFSWPICRYRRSTCASLARPLCRRLRKQLQPRPAAASSSCRSGSDGPRTHSPTRRSFGPP